MARIRVAVSPFYGGEDWTDAATGVTFSKSAQGLNVYSIPEHLDLSGIQKAIRLNALILMEGSIPEQVEEVVAPEPVVEAKIEEIEEVQAEEVKPEKETTKSKAKKASKK
jgi:hypothetical protein